MLKQGVYTCVGVLMYVRCSFILCVIKVRKFYVFLIAYTYVLKVRHKLFNNL
jgi:hypothetical protein